MVVGHQFSLVNKKTGCKERILVPFDQCAGGDDLIAATGATLYVGNSCDCFEFIKGNPSSRAGRIASAYVLADGKCVLLLPHHHDQVARAILPKLLVPQTHDYDREFVGKLNSTLMPLYTGVVRVQMLPDGIGVMIDVLRPPTCNQLQAVEEYYDLTSGETFVVEVNHNGRLLAWLRSFVDLDTLVKELHAGEANTVQRQILELESAIIA